jgi:hypothetical protein
MRNKCVKCSIEKIEEEILKCGFKCESGPLKSHRGYMSLLTQAKKYRDELKDLKEFWAFMETKKHEIEDRNE